MTRHDYIKEGILYLVCVYIKKLKKILTIPLVQPG